MVVFINMVIGQWSSLNIVLYTTIPQIEFRHNFINILNKTVK